MAITLDEYRFEILHLGGALLEVYPCDSFEIVWKRFQNEVFFRKSMSTLKFINDPTKGITDFDYFYQIENSEYRCGRLPLQVNMLCESGEEQIFGGFFHMVDGDWNVDHCTLEIDVRPSDKYSCIVDNWERPVNVFKFIPEEERIQLSTIYGEIEFRVCEVEEEIDGTAYFEFIAANDECIATKNIWWLLETHSEITEIKKKWFQNIFGGGLDFKTILKKKSVWVREKWTDGGVPSSGVGWVEHEGQYFRKPKMFLKEQTKSFESRFWQYDQVSVLISDVFDNGILIKDFIETLVKETCPELDVQSQFFGINAANARQNDAYAYADDYLSNMVVYQKSDVKNNNKEQNATTFGQGDGALTLKKVLDDLKVWANVYWDRIGDTIYIEHRSYFSNLQDWDLTQPPMKKFIDGMRQYSYKKSQLPELEYFNYMDDVSFDFEGLPIRYNNSCIDNKDQNNEERFRCNYTTNDVAWMIANSDEVSSDGIVFVAADDNVENIREDFVQVANVVSLNGALSFYNLLPALMLWDRPQQNGVVNNLAVDFYSSKKQRTHTPVTIYLCCNDIKDLTTKNKRTFLGWCEVESIKLQEPSGQITFNLEF